MKIKWTASSISFFVDGVEVSSFSTMGCESYFDSAILPVGIWNDCLSEMPVDWVFVTPKNVWLDQYDVANVLADLTDTTPGTRPNFFGYKNSYERIAQFSEEKGCSFHHQSTQLQQATDGKEIKEIRTIRTIGFGCEIEGRTASRYS